MSVFVCVVLLTFGLILPFDAAPIEPVLSLNIELELLFDASAIEPILLLDMEAVAIELTHIKIMKRKVLQILTNFNPKE